MTSVFPFSFSFADEAVKYMYSFHSESRGGVACVYSVVVYTDAMCE